MLTQPKIKSAQSGFSLIELMLAVAVTVLVVGAAVAFVNGSLVRLGSFAESRERNVRSEQLSERMRADIETAGLNLVRTSTEGAGTELVSFEGCCGFDTLTPGSIENVSGTFGASTNSLRLLGGGTGYVTFTTTSPTAGGLGLVGSDGAGCAIAINTVNPTVKTWAVVEDSVYVPTPMSVPGQSYAIHQPGDSFDIEIATRPDGTLGVNYYLVRAGARQLAYQSAHRPLTYPVSVIAYLANIGGAFRDIRLTGAPIRDRTVTPNLIAPMPMFSGGARPARPVFVSTTGGATSIVMLRGDVTTDPARLTRGFDATQLSGGRSATLYAGVPARGLLGESSDRLLLIDYGAGKSLLLFAADGVSASGGELPVPVVAIQGMSGSLGWGLFTSDASDLNHTYPAGSFVVKLDDPIEYRWDGQDTLFRRVGDEAWSVAATGVTQFSVSESSGVDSYNLRVSTRMQSDTAFTATTSAQAASSFFDTTFTPRSLNSTYRR